MAAVEAEADERGPGARTGLDRRGGVRPVVAEHISGALDAAIHGEPAQLAGQVIVERAVHVGHRDGHPVFDGVLTRGAHRVVDRDELGDIGGQAVAGAVAHLLGDGHHDHGAVREHQLGLGEILGQRQSDCDPRLSVEVPGDHIPVGGELGAGDQRDEVTDLQSDLDEVLPRGHLAVDADLDVVPIGGLGVDLVAERVPARLQRQDRPGDELLGVVAEDPDPGAGGEPGRERTDRNHLEAAVVLEVAHHAADGVGVHDQRPLGGRRLPGELRGQRPAAGQRERDAEVVEDVADELHHRVRSPGRARCLQQSEQRVDHPRAVRLGHRRGLAQRFLLRNLSEPSSTYRVAGRRATGVGETKAARPGCLARASSK